jgi:hypothetical protein
MQDRNWSRRDLLKTSTGLAAGVLFAEPVLLLGWKNGQQVG